MYIVFVYIKLSKDSSARYLKKAKKRFRQSLVKGIKIFLKNEKTKNDNMVVKDKRNLSENEKQKLDEYIKTYYEMQKKKKML